MDTKLIDLLYEAAIYPERWTDALTLLARVTRSASCTIMVLGPKQPLRAVLSAGLVADLGNCLKPADWADTDRFHRLFALRPDDFLPVDALVSSADSARDRVWQKMRLTGRGHQLASLIASDSHGAVLSTFERWNSDSPHAASDVARLAALGPHLRRAALLALCSGALHAQTVAQTLGSVGLAAAVLASDGKLIAANPRFHAQRGAVFERTAGDLVILDAKAQQRLHSALDDLANAVPGELRSIGVAAAACHGAAVLHLIKLTPPPDRLFDLSDMVMIVVPLADKTALNSQVLGDLFKLTAAEARLTAQLMTGLTLSEVASLSGVGLPTLRSQLSAVFAKSATSRQAELGTLLCGLWQPHSATTQLTPFKSAKARS